MKHTKNIKRKKRNRTIVSGLLVAVASIYLVARYFQVPGSDINRFMTSASLMVLAIIVLAIFVVTLMKIILWIGETALGKRKK